MLDHCAMFAADRLSNNAINGFGGKSEGAELRLTFL